MADIFSVMSELELSSDDIQQAETFAQQYLEAKFPTVDFRQGTGVRDLVIRPNAVMFALVKKYIEIYFESGTLASVTNDTPQEVVDGILSNFFVTRNTGSFATVRARLYFLFQNGTPSNVSLPTSAFFSTDNTRLFYPSSPIFAQPLKDGDTPISGNVYLAYDSSEELWYFDTDLSSSSADEEYNDLTEGDLLYFTLFNPYFVKGKILYMSEPAVRQETNVEMVDRSYNSISTRNLINDPSITSRITDVFNYVKYQKVVGMGDPDMWRDYVQVEGIFDDPATEMALKYRIHLGGSVDIYADTPFRTTIVQLTTDSQGVVELTGPIFDIYRSEISGGVKDDDIPLDKEAAISYPNTTVYTNHVPLVPQKDFGLSAKQILRIDFGLLYPNQTASFVVRKFTGLEDIQSFLEDQQNRVVCADQLCRAFEPILVNVEATGYEQAYTADEISAARKSIDDYFNQTPVNGTIYVSELHRLISEAGLQNVKAPMKVTAVAVAKDLVMDTQIVTDKYTAASTQRFYLDKLTITPEPK
jgi:hypothetical protein